tara:strand:+ start:326 stop:532 length:207 start_codon:yes stop_codon:yes gene_type:complete
MKKIKVSGIEGYYYVEDNYLCYYCDDLDDDIDVSDLSDLTIYQYNDLVSKLNKYYPEYAITLLEGRFI